jgi:hypothetical protein
VLHAPCVTVWNGTDTGSRTKYQHSEQCEAEKGPFWFALLGVLENPRAMESPLHAKQWHTPCRSGALAARTLRQANRQRQ